jgi:hypothetical protein
MPNRKVPEMTVTISGLGCVCGGMGRRSFTATGQAPCGAGVDGLRAVPVKFLTHSTGLYRSSEDNQQG